MMDRQVSEPLYETVPTKNVIVILSAFLAGDYVCKDCGYVFTQGPKAWANLPDNYGCPPCGAPKRRFTKVPKGSATGKVDVKKKWF